MPEFTNPFNGTVPQRKLTDSELARALRLTQPNAICTLK